MWVLTIFVRGRNVGPEAWLFHSREEAIEWVDDRTPLRDLCTLLEITDWVDDDIYEVRLIEAHLRT